MKPPEFEHVRAGSVEGAVALLGVRRRGHLAGEGGAVGSPAALANAIKDAVAELGVRVRATPVSPNGLFTQITAARREP